MPNLDDFRSSLELLLEEKKRKLEYYQTRIDDYVSRSERTKSEIDKLTRALSAKVQKPIATTGD